MNTTSSPLLVLGIDPGIARVGYGIVSITNGTPFCVIYGCMETRASVSLAHRLKELYEKLSSLVVQHRPAAAAIEKIFFAKNTKTALDVSHARGIMLLALSQANIPIFEYTPLQVKRAVTGYGRAEKKQMQKMVQTLLSLPSMPRPDDAADALALALCASSSFRLEKLSHPTT